MTHGRLRCFHLLCLAIASLAAAPLFAVDFPPRVLVDQPTSGGVLEDIESASGIVARRTFTDDAGRVVRRIDYLPNRPPYVLADEATDEPLLEHGTTVYHYDANGRLLLEAGYDQRRRLAGTVEYAYWPDGELRLRRRIRYDNGNGVVIGEDRRAADGDKTRLIWSKDGRRLVSMRGLVPPDVELAGGWGEPVDGLQCAVVPDGANVYLVIRNASEQERPLAHGENATVLQPVVMDATGEKLAYDRQQMRKNRASQSSPRELAPGHATPEFYRLTDWYGRIPPGRYTLTLRRRTSRFRFGLVSNSVEIEITPPTAVLTAGRDSLHVELDSHRVDVYPDRVVEHRSGSIETVGRGVRLPIESVTMTAEPGRITFASANEMWTATGADGRIKLTRTGAAAGQSELWSERFELSIDEGEVNDGSQ
jgi:hypothetical protein